MLGDFLYQLTEKDVRGAPVVAVIRRRDTQVLLSAEIANPAVFEVPPDQVLFATAYHVEAIPGGGQFVDAIQVSLGSVSGDDAYIERDDADAPLGARKHQYLLAPNPVPMWSRDRLSYTVNFSAAGVANIVIFQFIGLMIPRGNLQLA